MQIMIEIPKGAYEEIVNAKFPVQDAYRLVAWIKGGTPLPKGHGRIADIDEMMTCIKDVEGEDASWALALIEWVGKKRAIIEADRAESEE